MNTPPLLIGVTLLFWGWQTGLLPYAIIAAIILEAARPLKWRWEFSATDFRRLWDFCAVLCLGGVLFCYASSQFGNAVLGFARWLPLIFLPFISAQAYSARNTVDLSTFFWILRKRGKEGNVAPAEGISFTYPYFALCFVAASAANVRDVRFYMGACLLSTWALWSVRNRAFSPLTWGTAILLAIAMGYFGQIRLHALQAVVENKTAELLADVDMKDFDRSESRTAIGSIGRIKLSDRIVLRVKPEPKGETPSLLREASYGTLKSVARDVTWYGGKKDFHTLKPESNQTSWRFLPPQSDESSITIAAYLRKGMGVLALPNGTHQIDRLPVLEMEHNHLGTVRVADGPEMVRYSARYSPGNSMDSPPSAEDLQVPDQENPALTQVATQLKLSLQPPREALKTIDAFFRDHFTYSRFLGGHETGLWSKTTPLSDFLLRHRSGHCEFFATAAVLLLRKAGIPARYATGYSVQEISKKGDMYLVRGKHAHAWCLAYVDGGWRDFDTTPSSWVETEEESGSSWRPLTDWLSAIWFKFSEWRWFSDKKGVTKSLPWLLLVAVILFAWRSKVLKKRARMKTRTPTKTRVSPGPGADSEFYGIERKLEKRGFSRAAGETLSQWVHRIEAASQASVETRPLHPILSLHYRHRFDPRGLTMADREALKSSVQSWLDQHQKAGRKE